MSNPGGVNLNNSPYYDDFDEDKKFVRVLYNPGRAVQARELTQAQTLQQKQIQRFAEYFFNRGAIIDGCEQSLDLRMNFVKLQTTFDGVEVDVSDFQEKQIVGANTGIIAYAGIVSDLEGSDPKTLFINYLSAGSVLLDVTAPGQFITVGNTITFSEGNTATITAFYEDPLTGDSTVFINNVVTTNVTFEQFLASANTFTANTVGSDGNIITLTITGIADKRTSTVFEENELIFTKVLNITDSANAAYANTASVRATTHIVNEGLATEKVYNFGSKITVGDGITYVADHFVKNTSQTLILEKYKDDPSYKIGFVPSKTFVDSVEDTTLLDNAQGTPNFQAPGADRFRIDTVLTKVALDAPTTNEDFVQLIEVESGILKKRKTADLERKIEEAIAKRTSEESGDYTLFDPKVNIREHLNLNSNNGKFSLADGGNNSLLYIEVDPFVAYVKGYRNELYAKTGVALRKGLDTEFIEQTVTQLGFGGYINVREAIGAWNHSENETIDLYDTAQSAISNEAFSFGSVAGNKIGEAKIKTIIHSSGTPGTASAQYTFYLYDVVMSGGNLFEKVRSFYKSGSPSKFADVVLDTFGRATLIDTSFNRLVFELPYDGIKTLRDELNNVETGFKFRKDFNVSFSSSGVATIATTDASETFGSGLTQTLRNQNYSVVPTSNVTSSTLSGTVSVSAASSVVTGVSTSFDTELEVGDVIRINSEDKIISSISNATYLTLTSNHTAGASANTYVRVFPAGVPIRLFGNGGTGVDRDVTVSTPGAVTIDLKESGLSTTSGSGFFATVIATMDRSNAREMRKVLNFQRTVQIDANTHPNGLTGPYSLGYGDVYKIHAIYESSGFGITATTSNTNVTTSYTLDNGQRDNAYNHGTITPKAGVVPAGNLLVVFDHFTHDTTQGVGYLSVDSYPINDTVASNTTITTSDIPVYTSATTGEIFDLRNCIDLRPIKTANTAATNPIEGSTFIIPSGGLHIPFPDSDFIADLIHYKPRKAKLYIDYTGNLGINDGVPGYPNAQTPPQLPDTLEIAEFDVPVYPSEPIDVTVKPFKNKRFTMKDISRIQERVNKLEYYTALSLLEKDARDKVILDNDGFDRFKNGILVDSFVGHNVADVLNGDYKAAIDRNEKYVTAYANNEVQVSLRYNNIGSSGVTVTQGKKLMLSYTQEVFEQQPYASNVLNLATELTYSWVGDMQIYPATDNWLQTSRDPSKDFVVDLTGFSDNWRTLVDAWNTEVAPLNRQWVGVSSDQLQQTIVTQTGVVQRNVFQNTDLQLQQNSTIDIGQQRQTSVDRVADVSIAHTMRSRDFIFEVNSLKDGARLYAFFDDVNVTANCTQIELVGSTTVEDLFDLYDNNGILASDATKYRVIANGTLRVAKNKILGVFRVPANQFNVGQREFKLTDDAQNRVTAETTFARKSIFAQGLSIVKSQDVLNTRPTAVSFDDPRSVIETQRRVSTRTVDAVIGTRVWDPVAQSFFIDDSRYPEGVFLSSIDLFFREKSADTNLGVTVEIREMINGFPTRKIIGGETARRENSEIAVSASAALPTTFTFKNPIFLSPGAEYCFAVKPDGNSTEFLIWVAELGALDITNPEIAVRIDKQPAAGVVFTSSNDFTWSVRQNQDIKFTMRVANFGTGGTAILENIGVPFNQSFIALSSNIENLALAKTAISNEIRLADSNLNQDSFISFNNLESLLLPSVKQISNTSLETSASRKSVTVRTNLTTLNRYISPYLDLERVNVALTRFIINNSTFETLTGTASFTSGSNVVTGSGTSFDTELSVGEFVKFGTEYRQVATIANAEYMTVTNNFSANGSSLTLTSKNEENPTGPYASQSRYITRRVTLNDGFEATDLAVYLNVNRPFGTNIKVYYKILNENDTDVFDLKFYSEMSLDGTSRVTDDPNEFIEEKYVIPSSAKTGGTEILNGTVSVSNVSTDVVGTNTRFLEELRIGNTIAVGPSRTQRVVSNISNNTFLTVESAFDSVASDQEIFKALNNVVEYKTPDGRSYSGYKHFSVKIVFVSSDEAFVPKVKNLRVIALA